MRERLFRVIHKLEEMDWKPGSALVSELRKIAEKADPSSIEEIFDAFR